MRSHLALLVFLVEARPWSSSAFRHGSTSATQAANAFWLIRTKSSASFGFFSRNAPLTISELPYGLRPISFQFSEPRSLPNSTRRSCSL